MVLLAVALVAWRGALGNPMETYGYTARAVGLGGAMTAVASSFDATWYNPAGLGQLTGCELGAGLSVRRTFLSAQVSEPDAATGALGRAERQLGRTRGELDLGLASPIPLGAGLERVLFAGASVLLPGTTLYAIRERPIEQAIFPFLQERNDRLVLNLALAARWRWVMVGAGVSFLPSVAGRVDVDFTDGAGRNATSVDVNTSLSPNVGLLLLPVEGLSLGLVWRGQNRLDLAIPVSVVISEKITPVDLTVTAAEYSTPHELALGAAWKGSGWTVAGDVKYAFYRTFRASFPDVELFSTADGSASLESVAPEGGFRDTWAASLGGEVRVARGLDARAGASWTQSPVPAQQGLTNLLDGDRYAGSLGLGLDVGAWGGPPLSIDLAAAAGGFARNRDDKLDAAVDPANPGWPWVGGRGAYVLGTLSTTVRF